jgi:hypothetical protein
VGSLGRAILRPKWYYTDATATYQKRPVGRADLVDTRHYWSRNPPPLTRNAQGIVLPSAGAGAANARSIDARDIHDQST